MDEDTQQASAEVFWKLHQGLPQQAPGSDASTRRALAMIPGLPAAPRILDLGCGPGRQSIVLAQETEGKVVAVDLLARFLAELDARAETAGIQDRIETVEASMADLPYAADSFDLIWSEGAIYNMGFAEGLGGWRGLLRTGGAMAVTDAVWLEDDPPETASRFWKVGYPGMLSLGAAGDAVREAGFASLGCFVLAESEWWDDYYTPIEARLDSLARERDDKAWADALATHREELEIVRQGRGSFGYAFFVMQKVD